MQQKLLTQPYQKMKLKFSCLHLTSNLRTPLLAMPEMPAMLSVESHFAAMKLAVVISSTNRNSIGLEMSSNQQLLWNEKLVDSNNWQKWTFRM